MVDRDSRPSCPRSSGRSSSTPTNGTSFAAEPATDPTSAADRWPRSTSTTRSTSSTRAARPAFPRARPSPTTTSSTTRYFVGRAARLQRARPDLHPGAALPLLRDGDRQPRRRPPTAPAWSTRPRRSTPRRRCARAPRSAARASTACRRCSSPSSGIRTLRRVRPGLAADRDHGRVAVPGRGDEARVLDMGIDEIGIAFGMTETSPGHHPGAARRHARAPLRDRRPGDAPRRDQDRRSRDRPDRAPRRTGRVPAPAATW